MLVGYHKKGYPKQEPKNCLDLVNNETKKQPQANPPHPRPGWTARPTSNKYPGSTEAPHRKASDEVPILWLARGPTSQGLRRGTNSPTRPRPHATRPRTRYRFSDSSDAPHRKASDEVSILRLARGPAPRGLRRAPSYRLARGRLGIKPITTTLTDFSDETSHPTNTFNHSRDVSRTTARYSGVADETGVTSTPCYSR